jgi:hypothetical protein
MPYRCPVLTALCLAVALPAFAGQGSSAAATGAIATATPGVDIAQLPVNVSRIGRQLRQSTIREDRTGLKLHYTVDVFGAAPKLQWFTPLPNPLLGDVPGSSPTHADMIRMMTPKEFSPGVTLGTLPRR